MPSPAGFLIGPGINLRSGLADAVSADATFSEIQLDYFRGILNRYCDWRTIALATSIIGYRLQPSMLACLVPSSFSSAGEQWFFSALQRLPLS